MPTRRGCTHRALWACRAGTGVVNGLLARRSGASRAGQAGEHGLGEAGADVPGIPQAAAIRHAVGSEPIMPGPAAAAGPPATDDELGVADVRDLDSVPSLVPVMIGRQPQAQAGQYRPDQPRHSPMTHQPPGTSDTPEAVPVVMAHDSPNDGEPITKSDLSLRAPARVTAAP